MELIKKKTKTYKVEWKETVTYSVQVAAFNKEEAQYEAQMDYGYQNEIQSNYCDGTMKITEVL